MNIDEFLVIAGGIIAIVWVNWYFRVFRHQGVGPGPGGARRAESREEAP